MSGLSVNPLKVFVDVVPPIGAVIGFGVGLCAAVLTAVFASAIIAIAWLFYRPPMGILILASGAGLAHGFTRLRRGRPLQRKLA